MKARLLTNHIELPPVMPLAIGVAFLLATLPANETNAQIPICDTGFSWAAKEAPPNPYGVKSMVLTPNGVIAVVNDPNTGSWSVLGPGDANPWSHYATDFMLGGYSGNVNVIVSAAGSVYIGGSFDGFTDAQGNHVRARNVAKLDLATGTWTALALWPATPNAGFPEVSAMAIDSEGRIYAGLSRGAAATDFPDCAAYVLIWDDESLTWLPVGGGLRTDYYISPDSCFPSPQATKVGVTALTTDGTDLYVAGVFNLCGQGQVTTYHLAKWSYSSQSWSPIATNRDWCYFDRGYLPDITSIAVLSGTLFVTGQIYPLCGAIFPQGLTRFSTTGGGMLSDTRDNLWAGPHGTGYLPGAGSSLWASSCGVYAAGIFQSIGTAQGPGVAAWGIAKWNRDSGAWGQLAPAATPGLSYAAAGYPGSGSCLTGNPGQIIVSGGFDTAGDVFSPNMADWCGVCGDWSD